MKHFVENKQLTNWIDKILESWQFIETAVKTFSYQLRHEKNHLTSVETNTLRSRTDVL